MVALTITHLNRTSSLFMAASALMLPVDHSNAILAGRLLLDDGPTPVLIRGDAVEDVSRSAPTIADLMDLEDPASAEGKRLFSVEHLLALPPDCFLAPFDLQCIKAAGVTFAVSAIERVIEERARGDAACAEVLRSGLSDRVGADIRSVKPGSEAAARLKTVLIADGLWSQYLEVAIGPDAEIFTKSPPLSSVGWGDWIGVRSDSAWNNPEPEVVLACD